MALRLVQLAGIVLLSLPAIAQQPEDIPIDTFAVLDGFTGAEISPGGTHLAYLYPLDDRYHLVVHEFESGENQVIPPIETLDFRWIEWANQNTIVFSMSLPASRWLETRLLSLNTDTSEVTALIKPAEMDKRLGSRTARSYFSEPQIQDDVIDWMPDDPDYILVSLDEDFDARYEVRQVNIHTGDYKIFRKSIDGVQNWVADQDGDVRLGFGVRAGDRRVVLRDASGEWITVEKTAWYDNGWSPAAFTEDPDVIYVMGYGMHGTREVRTLRLSTGEFVDTLYSDPVYDAEGLTFRPRTQQPIGVRSTRDLPRIDYFDPEYARLQSTIDRALPGAANHIRSTTTDTRKIIIRSSSSRDPGLLLVWDREAKTMEPFGWYNQELDPDLMSEVTSVSYESSDGTRIPAYLTRPISDGPLPAIVLPHGGPESRDDASFWFLSQFLASRGYVVLQPNFRGSSGYGYAFQRAGREQWGGTMQIDVDAGARWLIDEGIADPERICILGWSYGGYSSAMGLIRSPELYQCGVGINGVYNLPAMIAYDNDYVGGTIWTRHIGLDGERSRSVSPHHMADQVEAPFLILHAEDDTRIDIDQAKGFHKQLRKSGIESELVIVKHGGHSMLSSAARRQILEATERFLSEHL